MLNGMPWRPKYIYAYFGNDTTGKRNIFITFTKDYNEGESYIYNYDAIDMKYIQLKQGRQTVSSGFSAFFLKKRAGTLGGTYSLLDTNATYIEITRQQNNYKEIWGKFKLTFYSQIEPDTLKFRDGKFHIKNINKDRRLSY